MGGKGDDITGDTNSSNRKLKGESNKLSSNNKQKKVRGRVLVKPHFVRKIKLSDSSASATREFEIDKKSEDVINQSVERKASDAVEEVIAAVQHENEDLRGTELQQEEGVLEDVEAIKDEADSIKAQELYIAQCEEEVKSSLKQRQLLLQKIQLLNFNINARQNRPDLSFFKNLNSKISKNSSFVRKLSSQLHVENKEALLREFKTLNLTMYATEAAYSIANSSFKLADVEAIVEMCSAFHQWYQDFSPELLQALTRNLQVENKKRGVLRLIICLFIVGVYEDESKFFNILKEAFDSKDLSLEDGLQSVLNFMKAAGRDLLGIASRSMSKRDETVQKYLLQKSQVESLSEEEKQLLIPLSYPRRLSVSNQKIIISLIFAFYERVSSNLVKKYAELYKYSSVDNNSYDVLQMSISGRDDFVKLLEQYEAYRKAVLSLADCLNVDFTELSDDGKAVFGRALLGNSNVVQVDKYSNCIWVSEEERRFYRELPDIDVTLKTDGVENLSLTIKGVPDSSIAETCKAEEEDKKQQSDKFVPKLKYIALPSIVSSKSSENEKASSLSFGNTSLFNAFMNNLTYCSSKKVADEMAIEFLDYDCKAWRQKCINFMLNNTGNGLDVLKYFGRFLAVVNLRVKDMVVYLLKMLNDEFTKFYNEKDQNNIEGKLRNIHFFGELVKFALCPSSVVFNLLSLCLSDFRHHNVDVACALLEVCGRFLYCTPESNVLMSKCLENMSSQKISKALPLRMELMIENAIASCKPSAWVRRNVRPCSPIELYIRKLIYIDLSQDYQFVLRQLRKLNWNEDTESLLLNDLIQLYKNKFQHFSQIAKLLAGLYADYHRSFVVRFVDELLEALRFNLEGDPTSSRQNLMMIAHMISELFNEKVIDFFTLLGVLYTLIRYRTSFDCEDCKYSLLTSTGNNDRQAAIDDGIRVRFVCTILINIKQRLFSYQKHHDEYLGETNVYLAYFQRFLFLQHYISYDSFLLTEDVFNLYRGTLQIFSTMEENWAQLKKFCIATDQVSRDIYWSLPYTIIENDSKSKNTDTSLNDECSQFEGNNLQNANDESVAATWIDGHVTFKPIHCDVLTEHQQEHSSVSHNASKRQLPYSTNEAESSDDSEEIVNMFDKFLLENIKQQSSAAKVKSNLPGVPTMLLKNKTKCEPAKASENELFNPSAGSDEELEKDSIKFHVLTRRQTSKSTLTPLLVPSNSALVNQHLKSVKETTRKFTSKHYYNINNEEDLDLFNEDTTEAIIEPIKLPAKMTYAGAIEAAHSEASEIAKFVSNQ